MRTPLTTLAAILFLGVALRATAHVPYLEEVDYSPGRPGLNFDVTQSVAMYSWLESPDDVDIYVCWVWQPSRFFVETLVPLCPAYESFFPSIAILGPGLPAPATPVIGSYSLTTVNWDDRSEPRETFYEPFGDKEYYQGPDYDQFVTIPGLYFIFVWDPDGNGGDYVLPIGKEERWPLPDIIRALIETPKIRRGEELHSPCGD